MERSGEVARLAGVPVQDVVRVDVGTVRAALTNQISAAVLEVGTQEPATYWRAGGRFWLDDPYFGDVVAFDELAYTDDLGLHVRQWG